MSICCISISLMHPAHSFEIAIASTNLSASYCTQEFEMYIGHIMAKQIVLRTQLDMVIQRMVERGVGSVWCLLSLVAGLLSGWCARGEIDHLKN